MKHRPHPSLPQPKLLPLLCWLLNRRHASSCPTPPAANRWPGGNRLPLWPTLQSATRPCSLHACAMVSVCPAAYLPHRLAGARAARLSVHGRPGRPRGGRRRPHPHLLAGASWAGEPHGGPVQRRRSLGQPRGVGARQANGKSIAPVPRPRLPACTRHPLWLQEQALRREGGGWRRAYFMPARADR